MVSGPSNQTPPWSPFAPAMRIAAISRRSAPSVPRAQVTKKRNLSGKARVLYSSARTPLPNPLPASRGEGTGAD